MPRNCGECDYCVPGAVGGGECHYYPITAAGWPAVGLRSVGCSQWRQTEPGTEYQFARLDRDELVRPAYTFADSGPYRLIEHPES